MLSVCEVRGDVQVRLEVLLGVCRLCLEVYVSFF